MKVPRALGRVTVPEVLAYPVLDGLSGALLLGMLIFSPWAFGTVHAWSKQIMNVSAYGLGILLLAKICIRSRGYYPARWDDDPSGSLSAERDRFLQKTLLILLAILFLYMGISALNARSIYLPKEFRFVYLPYIRWLPASFDAHSSWTAIGFYLALAFAFWSAWDWLMGKGQAEILTSGKSPSSGPAELSFPSRLRLLLMVLSFNGGLLALEGIVQRVAGSNKLLFMLDHPIHKEAIQQFGPFGYRSNAAQLFNLIWPATVALWWSIPDWASKPIKVLLIICAALMAACPVVSASRGGALVSAGLGIAVLIAGLVRYFGERKKYRRSSRGLKSVIGAVSFLAAAALLAYQLGWASLAPRMREIKAGHFERESIYTFARDIARDYPWYGTGPGTYEAVSELYRPRQSTVYFWPAQAHNDWLEFRICLGRVGSLLLCACLLLVVLKCFTAGRVGIPSDNYFILLVISSLAGCMAHARFDFPFQVYSIFFVFVILSAVLYATRRVLPAGVQRCTKGFNQKR